MRRTPARPADAERGSALISVILISLILTGLLTLALNSQEHAARTSARDRNTELALSVAEAGVNEAMAKVQQTNGTGDVASFTGTTQQGGYSVSVSRQIGKKYVIESTGSVGGSALGRERTVRVTMKPPRSFQYALFSETSVDLKNVDTVHGDVWANENVLFDSGDTVWGSVTAAEGYIYLKNGSIIKQDAWAGGTHKTQDYGLRMDSNAQINGNAKVSLPTANCSGGDDDDSVIMASSARIDGTLTTWGEKDGGGYVGTLREDVCTASAARKPLPSFIYTPENYSSATTFASVSAFQTYLSSNKTNLVGTFRVNEPAPSQSNRIDLTGVFISGDVTIVTGAPVFTNGIDDNAGDPKIFVVVSTYAQTGGCDVNHDTSDCAIHIKNNFDPSCSTVALLYAPNGTAAVKNNQDACGSVYAKSILVKNNQVLKYDARIERIVGFGSVTYEVSRWEERPT